MRWFRKPMSVRANRFDSCTLRTSTCIPLQRASRKYSLKGGKSGLAKPKDGLLRTNVRSAHSLTDKMLGSGPRDLGVQFPLGAQKIERRGQRTEKSVFFFYS